MPLRSLLPVEAEGYLVNRPLARPGQTHPVEATAGDVVLYRTPEGSLAPARLVELAGGGCWLARDARYTRGLVYLGAENIASRLPRPDLVGEAA